MTWAKMRKTEYREGDVINGLTFIREAEPYITPSTKQRVRRALFKCHCGNEFETVIQYVKSGDTKSCGCYRNQQIIGRNTWQNI